MALTPEEAIRTAIDYETRVAAVYREAAAAVSDPAGRRVFTALAAEEDGHVAYLADRLKAWQKTGALSAPALATAFPPPAKVAEAAARLAERAGGPGGEAELQLLRRAREVEVETSDFYRRMVDELAGEHRALFKRFVEIEEGHLAIVEAEIDSVDRMGFWLGFEEFDMSVER